ncbi:hypothetical protein [Pararhodobacter aggregans]
MAREWTLDDVIERLDKALAEIESLQKKVSDLETALEDAVSDIKSAMPS